MAKIESGELIYDPETKQFIPAPMKEKDKTLDRLTTKNTCLI